MQESPCVSQDGGAVQAVAKNSYPPIAGTWYPFMRQASKNFQP